MGDHKILLAEKHALPWRQVKRIRRLILVLNKCKRLLQILVLFVNSLFILEVILKIFDMNNITNPESFY